MDTTFQSWRKHPGHYGELSLHVWYEPRAARRVAIVKRTSFGRYRFWWSLTSAAAFGLGWACFALGPTALDFNNLNWIWGDLAQVYIAWGQYLYDSEALWLKTTRLSHPLPMSVSLFDPMPLLLLLARPFAGMTGEGHQFFGLYFSLCLLLQGGFGFLATLRVLALIRAQSDATALYIAVVSGILIASIPYTMFRFQGHTALSSQWVLVLSIWASLSTLSASRRGWILSNCSVLIIATGLNPYLALMVLISNCLMVLLRWKTYGLREASLRIAALLLVASAGLSLFGFIGAAGVPAGGYGVYSLNMLGPLDSNGSAGLFPLDIADPTGGQSFEGYAYLGLGVLLLGAMVLLSLVNYRVPHNEFPFFPAICIVAFCYILALSTTVTVSTHSWVMAVPDDINHLLSQFRASGRFFWMSGFWLIVIAVAALTLRFGLSRAAIVLSVIVVVQLLDVGPVASTIRNGIAHSSSIHLKGLDAYKASSILVYPPFQCDHLRTPGGSRNYELVGYYALWNQIPTNNFYAARNPTEQLEYHCDYGERLGQLDLQAMYLLSPGLYERFKAAFAEHFSCFTRSSDPESNDVFWVCAPRQTYPG